MKIDLYDAHRKMTAHLFPTFSSEDERYLALALCGEVGELVEMYLSNDSYALADTHEEIADIRIYLELLAKCFAIEGDKLKVEASPGLAALTDERLLLGLCAQCGLLANLIKKRWRDGVELDNQCRVLLIEIRNYVEQLAYRFGIEGSKLDDVVIVKLEKMAYKFRLLPGVEK
jgi:NTP pyrophosphatase (non-canonical NTP hydrolase)